MSQLNSVEDRLASLEREVADLRRQLNADGKRHWLEEVVGSQPDPDFLEVLRLGREFRAADRPKDGDEA
jgi:hypothetical protein